MSSIANRKFTDMRQIEFQQNGSSRITAMLTQPLLENSSTYMCEVTDLQCTIGSELAFPHSQWLCTVARRVKGELDFDPARFGEYVDSRAQLGKRGETWSDAGVYGTESNSVWKPWTYVDNSPVPSKYNTAFEVYSERYYSVMDFVYDLAQQLRVIDRKVEQLRYVDAFETNEEKLADEPDPDWASVEDDRTYHVSMTFDAGGIIRFHLSQYFRKNYHLVLSPLLQEVTGFPLLIGEFDGNGNALHHLADFQTDDDGEFQLLEVYEPNTTGKYVSAVRDITPIQDGIDIRKKVIVEVSLPISHTLSWDGQNESTRYVLQEFNFPQSMVEMSFVCDTDYTKTMTKFQEEGIHGQVLFLKGGSNLAIKKLQEGQMQAFRVDLLLDYNHWDTQTQKFSRRKKQLEIGQGGFFYLKLLFTKETV